MSTTIQSVLAREILDSRGRPTVEAEVTLSSGLTGRASVPSGASTGASEALELRDGGPRFGGYGVSQAVGNVNRELAPALLGTDAANQVALDQQMRDLDGTENKARLGANGILAVSMAAARAAALAAREPLWRYLHRTLFPDRTPSIPLPMINILSGGHHAGFQLDVQDALLFPTSARTTMEMLEQTSAVYLAVREILRERVGYTQLVADEGGFGPRLESNEQMLEVVTTGIERAGLRPGVDAFLALDIASSHFCRDGRYKLAADHRERDAGEMIDVLEQWLDDYPVISLEDGLAEDDWDGWVTLTQRLGERAQVLGDDLFTTNPTRLQHGIDLGCANSILIKVNQIGTVSEAAAACRLAFQAGYTAVVSTRSGETCDAFIVDLAVASGAGQVKPGSIARSERLAKFNQLLRLEEELGGTAFTGVETLRRWLPGA